MGETVKVRVTVGEEVVVEKYVSDLIVANAHMGISVNSNISVGYATGTDMEHTIVEEDIIPNMILQIEVTGMEGMKREVEGMITTEEMVEEVVDPQPRWQLNF